MKSVNKNERSKQIEQLLQNLNRDKREVNLLLKKVDSVISPAEGVKRIIDLILALLFLILLSPVFVITALAIVIENPGTVFYAQKRVGKDGQEFDFYKFRSMVMNADKMKDQLLGQNESQAGVIFKMKRDPRVTRVGRFIRRFSIDELPQLINVLKGDMSLVGPRPPLPREVAEYTLADRKRLHVIPGITCIWQVSGRSDIPFDQQVVLDTKYIGEHSIMQDFKLLFLTFLLFSPEKVLINIMIELRCLKAKLRS